MLMHRAGIKGLPGNHRRRPIPQVPTATDMVDRLFARGGPNQLWVTDFWTHWPVKSTPRAASGTSPASWTASNPTAHLRSWVGPAWSTRPAGAPANRYAPAQSIT
ncbi:hypothetical protein Psi02_72380 [Planotetraspora silvatica]|uniref:Uncharacterized protein n=1 Tax=Planotetraspora silvatica TaxID=234614 RepID=A0A8J3URX2_9ACTN|nr:hypothetical protein Psi02_72380 [Planotetraspora silvatica]